MVTNPLTSTRMILQGRPSPCPSNGIQTPNPFKRRGGPSAPNAVPLGGCSSASSNTSKQAHIGIAGVFSLKRRDFGRKILPKKGMLASSVILWQRKCWAFVENDAPKTTNISHENQWSLFGWICKCFWWVI